MFNNTKNVLLGTILESRYLKFEGFLFELYVQILLSCAFYFQDIQIHFAVFWFLSLLAFLFGWLRYLSCLSLEICGVLVWKKCWAKQNLFVPLLMNICDLVQVIFLFQVLVPHQQMREIEQDSLIRSPSESHPMILWK